MAGWNVVKLHQVRVRYFYKAIADDTDRFDLIQNSTNRLTGVVEGENLNQVSVNRSAVTATTPNELRASPHLILLLLGGRSRLLFFFFFIIWLPLRTRRRAREKSLRDYCVWFRISFFLAFDVQTGWFCVKDALLNENRKMSSLMQIFNYLLLVSWLFLYQFFLHVHIISGRSPPFG